MHNDNVDNDNTENNDPNDNNGNANANANNNTDTDNHNNDNNTPSPPIKNLDFRGFDSSRLYFSGVGILMSVEFQRESPGEFDSRTLNRGTLNRWTGRNIIRYNRIQYNYYVVLYCNYMQYYVLNMYKYMCTTIILLYYMY